MAPVSSLLSRIIGTRHGVSEMTALRRVKVALAGYMVTITFGVVFIAALAVVPNKSQSVALGAAIVMSLPLAIAFIGDKIQSFKGFGFEVETKAGAEPLTTISMSGHEISTGDLAAIPVTSDIEGSEFVAVATSEVTDSGEQAFHIGGLPAQVVGLIESPGSELVELDLRDGTYWWPTRLYLLAALLNDYTNLKRFVFVQAAEGGRAYAGMAKPSAVARRVELALPGLEAAYQAARQRAVADVTNGLQRPEAFDRELPPVRHEPPPAVDAARVVEFTAATWPQAVRSFCGIDEVDVKHRVNRTWLENTLGDDWRWAAIDVAGHPDSPLLQYQVVTSPEEYTALLTDGRLIRVIGRERLAMSIATAYLTRRLNS